MFTPEIKILRSIQYFSLLMSVVFTAGGWYLVDLQFALSLLLGAVLVNVSFWMLKRDSARILDRVAESSAGEVRSVQKLERIRFVFKFYAKLIVLGLLLYAVSTRMQLNMIGVALGLSTVMLSVFIVVLGGGRKVYSIQSARGV
jgi:hypothetical protein